MGSGAKIRASVGDVMAPTPPYFFSSLFMLARNKVFNGIDSWQPDSYTVGGCCVCSEQHGQRERTEQPEHA